MKIGLMIAFAKHMIAHGPDFDLKEGVSMDARRISSREMFWYLLDLELKRGMRYQNYFCVLTFKLCRIHDHANGEGLQTCYQALSHFLIEELRESDILGSLGEDQFAVFLPYADPQVGGLVRIRMEQNLKYIWFKEQGYEVMINQICFPMDGTDRAEFRGRKILTLYN
jgi:GGDEF domain-containing protein